MKVKKLKERLQGIPDDAWVFFEYYSQRTHECKVGDDAEDCYYDVKTNEFCLTDEKL